MKKNKDGYFSLRWGLSAAMAICWVVPIVIVVTVSGYLLNLNYERHVQHTVEAGTAHAMQQLEMRFSSAIDASKAVSYEGIVQSAYRQYLHDGSQPRLYRDMTYYLSRSYSRNENFRGVFITFLDQPEEDYSYVVPRGKNSYGILQRYREQAREELLELAASMDTGIAFRLIGEDLYMVRNLLNAKFEPYAVLTMLCDRQVLFQSLEPVGMLSACRITLDGTVIPINASQGKPWNPDQPPLTESTLDVSGHTLVFQAQDAEKDLWGAMPDLRRAVFLVVLLVVPLCGLAMLLIYRHVTKPAEVLVEASNRVEAGQRGYQITTRPHSREFRKLTRHFNSMSRELESQFERLYLEQQSLQEARIKALQSQINPHFLGNTLEIINWEARIAENDKVSAMIEALSTMLDAAIGRDGRNMIALREELTYIDAYLYIIQQRMGDGLRIRKEIDEAMLSCAVPRLLLQPLVENAVEHDISQRRGSELCIRACREGDVLRLEVEHEGSISPEDREKIDRLLTLDPDTGVQRGRVGIRNLNQRLHLIYGSQGSLTIGEAAPGRVLACVRLPIWPDAGRSGKTS